MIKTTYQIICENQPIVPGVKVDYSRKCNGISRVSSDRNELILACKAEGWELLFPSEKAYCPYCVEKGNNN